MSSQEESDTEFEMKKEKSSTKLLIKCKNDEN